MVERDPNIKRSRDNISVLHVHQRPPSPTWAVESAVWGDPQFGQTVLFVL